LKSGFIARSPPMPVVLGYIDWPNRTGGFDLRQLTGDDR
jgi:hypothetical protein